MLLLPPTNPITLPKHRGFSGVGKNEYTSYTTNLRERSKLDSGCKYEFPLRDAVGFFFQKSTATPFELLITWISATQCPTVQTHTPHCMQKDPAYNEPVIWDSSYPLSVASYDTHKGKRWLNSITQTSLLWKHRLMFYFYADFTKQQVHICIGLLNTSIIKFSKTGN